MKKLLLSAAALLATGSVLLSAATASAITGSGQAHLSLSTGSTYNVGDTVNVTVQETSSVAVVGVEADFSYNASQLQYLSTDTSSSAFNTAYPSSGGGGTVKIARTQQGGGYPTGTATIAVVSFKVLAGSGTANLTVLSSSDIDDTTASSVCDSSCAGGNVVDSFSLTTPTQTTPPPSSGSQTGTTGNKTSGSTSTSSGTSSSKPSSTSTGSTKSSTPTTSTTPTAPATSSKTTNKPVTKKVSTPSRHVTFRHAGLVTSGIGILVVAAAGLYWFFMRKTPATVPQQKKYSTRQKTTKSKKATIKS